MQLSTKFSKEDANKLNSSISSSIQLVQYSKELPTLIEFLDHYDLCHDTDVIKARVQALQNRNDIALPDTPKHLQDIQHLIGGLKGTHMKFFSTLLLAQEVIEFMHQEQVKINVFRISNVRILTSVYNI